MVNEVDVQGELVLVFRFGCLFLPSLPLLRRLARAACALLTRLIDDRCCHRRRPLDCSP